MTGPSRFIIGFAAALGLGLGLAAAINMTVDPAGFFDSGKRETLTAQRLLAGEDVALERQVDDRLVARAIIETLAAAPETVMIGSSRIAVFSGAHFEADRFRNFTLIEARVEDYIAVLGGLAQKNLLPKTVIIGLDPWAFNAANRSVLWQPLQARYESARNAWGLTCLPAAPVEADNKALRALSLGYLIDSLGELGRRYRERDTLKPQAARIVLRADGSMRFPEKALDHAAIAALAASIGVKPPQPVANFSRLDPCYASVITALAQQLKKAGVRVVFYFPPYHPAAYGVIRDTAILAMIPAAEQLARSIAMAEAAIVAGSYDPAQSGCAAEQFLDWHHFDAACAQSEAAAIRRKVQDAQR